MHPLVQRGTRPGAQCSLRTVSQRQKKKRTRESSERAVKTNEKNKRIQENLDSEFESVVEDGTSV